MKIIKLLKVTYICKIVTATATLPTALRQEEEGVGGGG